jgi:DNA-binding XRE family transcriptional regulator
MRIALSAQGLDTYLTRLSIISRHRRCGTGFQNHTMKKRFLHDHISVNRSIG